MGLLTTVSFCMTVVAFIFNIVALASDAWGVSKASSSVHSGLWSFCVGNSCNAMPTGAKCDSEGPACDEVGAMVDCDECDKLNATRASVILAMIFGLIAVILAGKAAFAAISDGMRNGFFALCIFAGFWLMVAMAIYADDFDSDNLEYGYGFIMCILAWLLYWGAPILAHLGK